MTSTLRMSEKKESAKFFSILRGGQEMARDQMKGWVMEIKLVLYFTSTR